MLNKATFKYFKKKYILFLIWFVRTFSKNSNLFNSKFSFRFLFHNLKHELSTRADILHAYIIKIFLDKNMWFYLMPFDTLVKKNSLKPYTVRIIHLYSVLFYTQIFINI